MCLCAVKLWCTNQPNSLLTIDSRANICSVKFNPSSFRIAFGSAGMSLSVYLILCAVLFVCLILFVVVLTQFVVIDLIVCRPPRALL